MIIMNKIAAAIGWIVILFSIAGAIDPSTNFIMYYGKKETCTLNQADQK